MATNGVVLVVVARNLAIPGLPWSCSAVRRTSLAMVVNGGYMPVSRGARWRRWASGRGRRYSNSAAARHVALAPLTDIFAMPAWLPVANVFSVGDGLIGAGVAVAIVAGMHGRGPRIEAPVIGGRPTPLVRPGTDPHGRCEWTISPW